MSEEVTSSLAPSPSPPLEEQYALITISWANARFHLFMVLMTLPCPTIPVWDYGMLVWSFKAFPGLNPLSELDLYLPVFKILYFQRQGTRRLLIEQKKISPQELSSSLLSKPVTDRFQCYTQDTVAACSGLVSCTAAVLGMMDFETWFMRNPIFCEVLVLIAIVNLQTAAGRSRCLRIDRAESTEHVDFSAVCVVDQCGRVGHYLWVDPQLFV